MAAGFVGEAASTLGTTGPPEVDECLCLSTAINIFACKLSEDRDSAKNLSKLSVMEIWKQSLAIRSGVLHIHFRSYSMTIYLMLFTQVDDILGL